MNGGISSTLKAPMKILFTVALLSAVAVLIWQSNTTVIPLSSSEDHQHPNPPATRVELLTSPASAQPGRPASTSKVSMRAQFRESGNYAEFVRGLAGAATAGDPIAEYLTARALKYCHDNARLSLQKQGGALRTRDELEIRLGKYPVDLQHEILEAYDRCHEFFADLGQAAATTAWQSWLDKASTAGYPPAQSLKADVSRQVELMRDSANASPGDVVPPTAGPARDLALVAVLTGDPDSIFEMMNWVDGTKHSTEDYGELSGAWELLACQRGYDECGPTSQWFRSGCSWDVQCADDNSVIDTLRRQFGSRFVDVQNLANSIGLAIDQKDQKAIESYL
jgi:hypothetical protein